MISNYWNMFACVSKEEYKGKHDIVTYEAGMSLLNVLLPSYCFFNRLRKMLIYFLAMPKEIVFYICIFLLKTR